MDNAESCQVQQGQESYLPDEEAPYLPIRPQVGYNIDME